MYKFLLCLARNLCPNPGSGSGSNPGSNSGPDPGSESTSAPVNATAPSSTASVFGCDGGGGGACGGFAFRFGFRSVFLFACGVGLTFGSAFAFAGEEICQTLTATRTFEIREVEPRVFHLSFGRRGDLTRTFLRFQEYYESPRFRNRIFSLDEFKVWYRTTTPSGRFTYYSDWNGFNLPDYALTPFRDGRFREISKMERSVLDSVQNASGKFYVIASVTGKTAVMDHELAHAHFYLNDDYREEMTAAVRSEDTSDLREWLKKKGYTEEVFDDEVQAYLLFDWPMPRHKKYRGSLYPELQARLRAIYRKHYPTATATAAAPPLGAPDDAADPAADEATNP